jgi:hypothetical protein
MLKIRKSVLNIETIHHEGGAAPPVPLIIGTAAIVVANPFAGRYVEDIAPLMDELKPLGQELAAQLLAALGGKAAEIQAFGKGAIVGVNGELEHAALWHAPGGHALRQILEAKGFVPSGKMLGSAGVRLMIPLLHKDSVWVRSHFNTCELTIHDAPRPDEIVFAVAMGTGSRIHARVGGLTIEQALKGEKP